MNVTRLRLLRSTLVRAERDHSQGKFDMTDWHCGTAYCAAGLLCLQPKAQAEGLHLVNGALWGDSSSSIPTYRSMDGFEALAGFLGITEDQSFYLFDPVRYEKFDSVEAKRIIPRDVIERVDEILAMAPVPGARRSAPTRRKGRPT